MLLVQSVSWTAAFLAGLASFFSPCILPLVPAYFTFITGLSLEELTEENPRHTRKQVLGSTLAFVAGFSIVFVLLGASASMLGSFVRGHQGVLRIGGGLVIIVLGLHVSGLLRLRFLEVEKRLHLNKKPVHALGTVLVGMAFGAGWSPCIGPILSGILALAANQKTMADGMALLSVYSAGLAIPFLVLSVFVPVVLSFVRKTVRYMRYVNAVAGGLLVVMGLLLVSDKLRVLM
ncbi:MAG: cytochrome c biogenesis protein CcdA [Thermodesulfobacteriota bacterium]